MGSSRLTGLVGRSFGVAAVVATAQVGVVQGVGIIDWGVGPDPAGQAAWRDVLTWIFFVFAVAVLAGAAAARRTIRDIRGARVAVLARMTAVLCAGLGAVVAVPLLWLPARAVPSTLAANPAVTVAVSAGVGVAIGMVLALGGLTAIPIGVNLAITVGWVWLLGLGSAALAYARGIVPATPRLGVIDAPALVTRADLWLGPLLMIGIAGVVGLVTAATGRWLDSPRLGIALSGFAGPALVASGYLVGGLGGASPARLEPYISSLLAVTVGLLVSTGVSGLHRAGPVVAPPAVTPAIVGRPRRLAIEAAPLAERPERTATSAGRTARSRSVRAITAQPHVATEDASPQPAARVLVAPGSEEDRRLRKSEREHIGWMEKLVNTPDNPDLLSRPRS